MEKYHNTIQETNGDIITTATVTVYNAVGGAIASIFEDDETTPLPNPFTVSDANYGTDGSFWFKGANAVYNIKVVNGASTKWVYDVTLFDFEDATAPNDLTKTVDPTVTDDSDTNWEVGSRWLNQTSNEAFVALDVTVGAAVWSRTTLNIEDLGTMALQAANAVAITGGTVAGITSLDVTGNVGVTGTVDSRDIFTDGQALDLVVAEAVREGDTTTAPMQFVIDEDSFASDLATKVPTQQSVKAYIASQLIGNLTYQGGYNASTNTPNLDTSPSGIVIGDSYTCTVAGTFFTVGLEVGDFVIAEIDNPTVEADWTIVNKDLDPSSILAALLTVDTDGSGLNCTTLQSAAPAEVSTPSTIAKRDANGDLSADSFIMNDAAVATNHPNVMVGNASGLIYLQSEANFISNLGLAVLASPAFTGNPTAPTQTAGNNSTRLASTAFVTAAIAASSAASGFPAGTRMVFQQNLAPTGWTKETAAAYGDAVFRNYSGTYSATGGAQSFATKMTTNTIATSGGSVTNASITEAQTGAHKHLHGNRTGGGAVIPNFYGQVTDASAVGTQSVSAQTKRNYTSTQGSGSVHGHGFTQPALVAMNIKYIGTIVAQKD